MTQDDAISGFDSIPREQYDAMRRICNPMLEAAHAMTGEEIALAMKGFHATTDSNCPWYVFALRWAMPPLLATVGSNKEGYEEAFITFDPKVNEE